MIRYLKIRSTNKCFPTYLAHAMASTIWSVLRRTASAEAVGRGSFAGIRAALSRYVSSRIREVAKHVDGSRTFSFAVDRDEPEIFGLEAAAAVALAQGEMFSTLSSPTRTAMRIAREIEVALSSCLVTSGQDGRERVMGRSGTDVRSAHASEPALAESRVT